MVYYPIPLQGMKVFGGRCIRSGNLEESEKAAKEVLSLPIEPLMDNDSAEYTVEAVKEFLLR